MAHDKDRGEFLPTIITKAQGSYVYAKDKKILDFTSGQMSAILGHGHPEIAATVYQAFSNLDHLFSGFLSPPVIDLAAKLVAKLPTGLDKCQFLSTGGESNEAAIKMAKLYTGKFEVVGIANSWHGVTAGATAATFQAGRKGYGPIVGALMLPMPNAYRSIFRKLDGSYDWEAELEYGWSLIDIQSVGSLACCIVEPILSSGGVHVLPDGYLRLLKKHCEARKMLLIVDEAQTALGRTGEFFAFENSGIVPDFLTMSKTLGAGLALSAVVTSRDIEEVCASRNFSFYTTHASDPMPAAIGLKVMEIVERDNLTERARILGNRFRAGLSKLKSEYACIGDIRGRGLMIGLEVITDPKTRTPAEELGSALGDRLLELGLSANVTRKAGAMSCFRIAPPLTTSEEELDAALDIFRIAFATTDGTLPISPRIINSSTDVTTNGTANDTTEGNPNSGTNGKMDGIAHRGHKADRVAMSLDVNESNG